MDVGEGERKRGGGENEGEGVVQKEGIVFSSQGLIHDFGKGGMGSDFGNGGVVTGVCPYFHLFVGERGASPPRPWDSPLQVAKKTRQCSRKT